jgi:hypothetical protein
MTLATIYGRTSRRRVLGLAVGALVIAGSGSASAAEVAKPKKAQKAVDYQGHPKGGKGCNTCKAFQPPSKCKTVESPVEAGGWCNLYERS